LEQTDYYAILQVEPDATHEQIRLAYKRLALAAHPDLWAHPHANRRMQLLNEAYEVLGSAENRAEYDRQRNAPPALVREEAWMAEWPAAQAAPAAASPAHTAAPHTHRAPPDPLKQREAARKRQIWLKRQLKIMAIAVLFTLGLFAWSLVTGRFDLPVILLLAAPVIYVVITLFRLILGQIRG
jgi:curved DNA-binding protein CbpA